MKRRHVLAAALLLSIGCGGAAPMARSEKSADSAGEGMAMAGADAAKDKAPNANDTKPRKIIYNANATLVVEEFDKAARELKDLIDKVPGAYKVKEDVNLSPHSRRSGTWTIRVPVDQREAFMDDVARLGELHHSTLDSKDITDEFYDLEGRIKNKQARQEALRELLKKKTDKVEELLAVDRELAKVTEDIESAQAQLQRWTKQSDFATVVLKIQDRRDYVPPSPISPTFGITISRTWASSLEGLVGFLKGLVVVLVFLVPWLPVIAVVLLPFYLLIRMAVRSVRRPESPAEPLAVVAAPTTPAPTT